ncbi:hypothetical protein GCM10020216_087230 [Nonomuraea helvata]
MLGLVIAVVVAAASIHDNAIGNALLDRVAAATAPGSVRTALVDQGFKNTVVAHGAGHGIAVKIVERNPAEAGFVPQPKRWVVEQTYGTMSLHRRLVRDYEHDPASSESRVYWAMTDAMTRRLTGTSTPHLALDVSTSDPGTWLLNRIDARERALTSQIEQTRDQIEELTARLQELDQELDHLRITRKTLLVLAAEPDPAPPPPPAPVAPDHPAYQPDGQLDDVGVTYVMLGCGGESVGRTGQACETGARQRCEDLLGVEVPVIEPVLYVVPGWPGSRFRIRLGDREKQKKSGRRSARNEDRSRCPSRSLAAVRHVALL